MLASRPAALDMRSEYEELHNEKTKDKVPQSLAHQFWGRGPVWAPVFLIGIWHLLVVIAFWLAPVEWSGLKVSA